MTMRTGHPRVSLYVDRSRPSCWIVRDGAGDFWSVPAGDRAWERRQPYTLAEDARLEPVPGHYKYLLGIVGCRAPDGHGFPSTPLRTLI